MACLEEDVSRGSSGPWLTSGITIQTWLLGSIKGNGGELPKNWDVRPMEWIDNYKKFLL